MFPTNIPSHDCSTQTNLRPPTSSPDHQSTITDLGMFQGINHLDSMERWVGFKQQKTDGIHGGDVGENQKLSVENLSLNNAW